MHLKLSWKLALIGISSTVPLLCGTFYLINLYTNRDIRFAALEQDGNRCLRPLDALLESLPEHQALLCAGGKITTGELAAKQTQIGNAFAALQVALHGLDADVKSKVPGPAREKRLQAQLDLAQNEWREFARPGPMAAGEIADREARLVSAVRAMITSVANASNLILDPDLDSYYLMDLTVGALPQTQDRIARATVMDPEFGHFLHFHLTSGERVRLAVLAAELKESDLNRVAQDVRTALDEDSNFHGVSGGLQRRLPPAASAFTAAMERLIVQTDQAAGSDRPAVSPAAFEAAANQARELSFQLWRTGSEELDRLLQKRIDDFSRGRAWGAGLMAVSLLLSAGVTVFIFKSIRRVEETLRESGEKFSKAFRSNPNGIFITEMETGRYLEVNESFARLYGYAQNEMVGRTSLELGVWENPAERARLIRPLLTGGSVRNIELNTRTRGGEARILLVSAELIEIGGSQCIVGGLYDITGRKAAEAARERSVLREQTARKEFARQLIASQETERRRIAGELHDSLGQNLLLIKNRAQLILAAEYSPAALREQIGGITELAALAIVEVRQISHDLRPYQLDQLGLTRALQAMIGGAAESTAIAFSVKLEPVDDVFSADAATQLYRIVQEGLNNIMKHAAAGKVRIGLERDVRHVRLEMADDGRGMETNGRADGFGLQNIAGRVDILGGELTIDSRPGAGTRLEITIPLPGIA